jgi:hypothetical protein
MAALNYLKSTTQNPIEAKQKSETNIHTKEKDNVVKYHLYPL